MAARITRPSSPTTGTSRNTSRNSKSSKQQWLSIQEFFKSQQFQLIAGILLLFTALMLLIAYISFFFTGANDMSIIEQTASRSVMREAVTNALGLPGAIIASGMIDGMFGIMALLPILLLGIYALRILFTFALKNFPSFFAERKNLFSPQSEKLFFVCCQFDDLCSVHGKQSGTKQYCKFFQHFSQLRKKIYCTHYKV